MRVSTRPLLMRKTVALEVLRIRFKSQRNYQWAETKAPDKTAFSETSIRTSFRYPNYMARQTL